MYNEIDISNLTSFNRDFILIETFKYYLNYDNYYHNNDKMGLLQLIKKNKDLRKIFGERELKIIEKQLLGIQLTKSETTRLSRDIRKKFEVIKELAPFSEEFELKKGAEIKSFIEEAKEVIMNSKYFNKINKIILFGSTVNNQLTFMSDIDLAVEFSNISNREATKFRIEMSGRVNDRIDIQVLNILPTKIKKEIIKNGKIIYKR
ncbi:MAG: nucleotidyltransferase domain-containing protein [Candidatus Nanoarchaeia archaeon]|nr:nucleotidyltransferase domain-containing protein [Candidatus Nanoarchaeia archaeon]